MGAVFEHGLTKDRVVAFANAELVDRTFGYIEEVAEHSDELTDALYFVVGEMLERFAPDEARAELKRTYMNNGPFCDPADADDLLDALEDLRRREAARLLRDTLETREADYG